MKIESRKDQLLLVICCLVDVTFTHNVWFHNMRVDHLHRGECREDWDCDQDQACHYYVCRDPCIGACGYGANCKVKPVVI